MKKTYFIVAFIFLFVAGGFAQTRLIKGYVLDAQTDEALIAAYLSLSDTTIGLTNIDGYFEIEVPASDSVLFVSYTGYQTQKMYIICDDCVHKVALLHAINLGEFEYYGCCLIGIPIVFGSNQSIYSAFVKKYNEASIFPTFNSTSGVFAQSGALNENRLTIRGIGANSPFGARGTKVYLEDIPITSVDGISILNDLDMSAFDEVNVIKSPNTSTFGAALGGGIFLSNYETCKNTSDSEFSTTINVGSFGQWRNANNLDLYSNNLNLHIFQNTTTNGGYRENSAFSRQSFGISGTLELGDVNYLKFLGFYSESTGELPSSLDEVTYIDSPVHAAPDWLATNANEALRRSVLGLTHRFIIGEVVLRNTLFYNSRNRNAIYPSNFINDNTQNLGWSPLISYGNRIKSVSFNTRIGGEFLVENTDLESFRNENNGDKGVMHINNQITKRYDNLFGDLRFTIDDDLSVSTGINVNRTKFDIEDILRTDSIDYTGDYTYDWIFSPRLGLNYRFAYENQVFASANHGYVIPIVEEILLLDGSINTTLQPTTGWTYEIGTKGNIDEIGLRYIASLYRMSINNLIVPERISENIYISTNAEATIHNGVELNVQYNYYNDLRAEVNYSYNNYVFKAYENVGNDYAGNKLTGVPSNILNINLFFEDYDFPFYARLNYRFVDGMPILDDNSLFTESYQLLDIKAGFTYKSNEEKRKIKNTFGLEDLEIDMYLGVNNLFNTQYASMITVNPRSFNGSEPRMYYPGLPRNFYGGVRIVFDL